MQNCWSDECLTRRLDYCTTSSLNCASLIFRHLRGTRRFAWHLDRRSVPLASLTTETLACRRMSAMEYQSGDL